MEQTASPAKYTKEDIDRIARSASFVENLCIAMNIINDSVAMHGDLMVKQDIGNIQRAHELLKNTVDSYPRGSRRKRTATWISRSIRGE